MGLNLGDLLSTISGQRMVLFRGEVQGEPAVGSLPAIRMVLGRGPAEFFGLLRDPHIVDQDFRIFRIEADFPIEIELVICR